MLKRLIKTVSIKNCFLIGKAGKTLNLRLKEPIFIVGTGRCGTTLLVRILRSNSDISVFPGEANELWHPKLFPFEKAQIESPPIEIDPKSFTALSVEHWPANHSERIKQTFNGFHLMVGNSKTLIVKSAMISFMMSQIKTIFPGAKYIHIYRYGPSVIESYFKKNFGKYSKYSYTEYEYYRACAKYWNSCILNIEQERISLSLAEKASFFEFSYEDFCNDPEGILQGFSNFLNVDYAKFTFDLSSVRNTNFKVNSVYKDKLKHLIDDEIYPAMKLKGYIS